LVISQFIQGKFQRKKRPIDFILFYYYFAFFRFKRGYCVNDQLDFISKVIKRYYNSNDRLKFILNKWLKHVKRGYEKQTK